MSNEQCYILVEEWATIRSASSVWPLSQPTDPRPVAVIDSKRIAAIVCEAMNRNSDEGRYPAQPTFQAVDDSMTDPADAARWSAMIATLRDRVGRADDERPHQRDAYYHRAIAKIFRTLVPGHDQRQPPTPTTSSANAANATPAPASPTDARPPSSVNTETTTGATVPKRPAAQTAGLDLNQSFEQPASDQSECHQGAGHEDGSSESNDAGNRQEYEPASRTEGDKAQGRAKEHALNNNRKEEAKQLSPSRVRAKTLHDWAMDHIAGAEQMTYDQLHHALLNDARVALEDLPSNSTTFARYCRGAGVVKNHPVRSRNPTSSIRRADQL